MAERMASVKELQLHSEVNRVPKMSDKEFLDFVADIGERGILEPLCLQPGTNIILDGRHRFLAAKKLKISEIKVRDADLGEDDDPVVYLLRAASKRRMLKDDQRACIAAEEEDWLVKKNKKESLEKARAAKASKKAGGPSEVSESLISENGMDAIDSHGKSRAKTASAHNVGPKPLQNASYIKDHAPDLFQRAKNGEIKVSKAKRLCQREQAIREGIAEFPARLGDLQQLLDLGNVDGAFEEYVKRMTVPEPPPTASMRFNALVGDAISRFACEWGKEPEQIIRNLVPGEVIHFRNCLRTAANNLQKWLVALNAAYPRKKGKHDDDSEET